MLEPTLRAALDELHAATAAANPGNLGELAALLAHCQKVQTVAGATGNALILQAAQALLGAVNTLIMDEDPDGAALMGDLQQTTALMVAADADGRVPAPQDFPVRWGFAPAAPASSAAGADAAGEAPDPEILAEFLT